MGRPVTTLHQKTCFRCVHYTLGRCMLFDEQIDSELYSARDCDSFEVAAE